MDNKELNDRLRQSAVSHGLCALWQREWTEDWSREKMVSQFYRGLDFFLKKRYVSNDFLKENFDNGFLRQNGILVDDNYSLLNPKSSILIGKSSSRIRFNGRNCANIYIIDDSKAMIAASGNSFVIVHLLGNASVEAVQKDNADLVIINHTHNSSISSEGNVRIKEEFDYLK